MLQLKRAERFEALLFLLAGGALTAFIAVFLLGLIEEDPKETYFIKFDESISGIDENTRVLFAGVPCGQVTDISLGPDMAPPVTVYVELDSRIAITAATRARIALSSIIGRVHIELENSGEDDLPRMDNQILASPSKMSELLETGESLAERMVDSLQNVTDLTSEARQEQLFRTIEEIGNAAETLRAKIPELAGELEATSASLRQTSDEARRILLANEPTLTEGLADARRILKEIDRFLADRHLERLSESAHGAITRSEQSLRQTLSEVDGWLADNTFESVFEPPLESASVSIESVAKRARELLDRWDREGIQLFRSEVAPTLASLNELARGLTRLTRLLEREPRALLFGDTPRERPLPRRLGGDS